MPSFWEKYKKDVAQKAQSNIGIVTGLPSRICDGHHTLIKFLSLIINNLENYLFFYATKRSFLSFVTHFCRNFIPSLCTSDI
jgi:hypothetical protein